jgi:hypothetical protein
MTALGAVGTALSKAVLLAVLIIGLAAPQAAARATDPASPAPSETAATSEAPAAGDDGGLAGGIAAGLANRALDSLFETIGEAAVWAFGRVLGWVDSTASPDVTQPWFSEVYGRTYWLSAIIALIALVWALTTGALRNGVTGMVSVIPRLLSVVLGLAVAVPIVQTLLEFTDWLSERFGGQVSENMQDMAGALGAVLVGGGAAGLAARGTSVPGFILAVVALVIVVGALLVWLQLIFRTAVIYLLLAAAAFPAAMSVNQTSARPLRKISAWIVAMAFAKPVIVLALWIGSAPFAGDGEAGIAAVLTGAGVMATAVFAPWGLFKLFDFAGDQVTSAVSASANPRQMRTHVEHPVTTYRRTTSAVHDRASTVREHGLLGFSPARPRTAMRPGAAGTAATRSAMAGMAGVAGMAAAGGLATIRAATERGRRPEPETPPASSDRAGGGSGEAASRPAAAPRIAHASAPDAAGRPADPQAPQPFIGPPSPATTGDPAREPPPRPQAPRPPGMTPWPPASTPAPPSGLRRPPVDPRGA